MAQKRRGLETPSARPTDVFFPESQEPSEKNVDSLEGSGTDRSLPDQDDSTQRGSDDIAATLLAPSKRARRSTAKGSARRHATERDSSESGGGAKKKASSRSTRTRASESVSRETPSRRTTEESGTRRNDAAAARTETPSDTEVKGATETVKSDEAVPKVDGAEEASLVPVPGATFADLPVDVIAANPHQPRLLQPIVVRRRDREDGSDADYELIMGERRLRAAKEAGLETIPAVVRYAADDELLRDALLENLHRVQLNPLEEAAAYQQLLEDFNCTHAELSQRIARSRSQISNTLRLMKLPPLVQRRLAAGVMSAGHARALLGLPDAAAMERIAQRIVAEGLSVRATEELVALHDEPDSRRSKPLRNRSATLPALSTRLSDAFDTRVKVTRGAKKGRITIEFAGDDDLARIVTALAPGTSLEED